MSKSWVVFEYLYGDRSEYLVSRRKLTNDEVTAIVELSTFKADFWNLGLDLYICNVTIPCAYLGFRTKSEAEEFVKTFESNREE